MPIVHTKGVNNSILSVTAIPKAPQNCSGPNRGGGYIGGSLALSVQQEEVVHGATNISVMKADTDI
jgi:hypothetical protein